MADRLNANHDRDKYYLHVISLDGHQIKIFSIVPGIVPDAQPEPVTINYPFSEAEWKLTVQAAHTNGMKTWRATHGCEGCTSRTNKYGYRRVNPSCAYCDGEGTVLG